MKYEDIVKRIIEKPYLIRMGAGKLAKRFNCTKEEIYKAKQEASGNNKQKLPKILIFDIETTPLEAYVFQTQVWKARIPTENVISEWFMLTWSAKWLFSDKIMSMRLTGTEVLREDDKRIVKELWKLLDEADIVIAHNGDSFDVPNINSRFIVNGLSPTSPYQTIDTKKIAAKQFGFTHNSLNALAKVFGFEPKLETNFNLWKRCKNGDNKALAYMEEYNRGDVELLEEVYLKLRPWIKGHPSCSLYMETDGPTCPNCGSDHTAPIKDKHYMTSVGVYVVHRCDECGAVSRERKSIVSKEKKNDILLSVGR